MTLYATNLFLLYYIFVLFLLPPCPFFVHIYHSFPTSLCAVVLLLLPTVYLLLFFVCYFLSFALSKATIKEKLAD